MNQATIDALRPISVTGIPLSVRTHLSEILRDALDNAKSANVDLLSDKGSNLFYYTKEMN